MYVHRVCVDESVNKILQSSLNISHLSLKFYDKIVYFATNIKIRKNVGSNIYILSCKNRKKIYFFLSLYIYIPSKFFLSFKNDHYSLERNLFLVQLLHSKETIHNKLSNK